MIDVIIACAAEIITTLVVTLIGVFGAWLTAKLAKRLELANINAAIQEVIGLAQLTAAELQQTVVDKLKASREDGKLTQEEINALGKQLIEQTKVKMSGPAFKLLQASAVDINALIKGAGEEWINNIKYSTVEAVPVLEVPAETFETR